MLGVLQIPKAPRKDFYKLMNKDKIVLRFGTRFVETSTHQLSSSDRSVVHNLRHPWVHVDPLKLNVLLSYLHCS